MTVRTKYLNVLFVVVIRVPIQVIKFFRERLSKPILDSTSLTFITTFLNDLESESSEP